MIDIATENKYVCPHCKHTLDEIDYMNNILLYKCSCGFKCYVSKSNPEIPSCLKSVKVFGC